MFIIIFILYFFSFLLGRLRNNKFVRIVCSKHLLRTRMVYIMECDFGDRCVEPAGRTSNTPFVTHVTTIQKLKTMQLINAMGLMAL